MSNGRAIVHSGDGALVVQISTRKSRNNDEIYDKMTQLKHALEIVAEGMKHLYPEPPIEMIRDMKTLAVDLDVEVTKRRGH